MCRCIYVENCIFTKFESYVVRYINVDRYLSRIILRSELHLFYRYVSRHELTCCPIDLHVVCNLSMEITQRNWKYVDTYKTKLPVI